MAPLWTTLRKRLNRPYDEFQAYQRSLPYKTVVPEPPHSLGEHLAAALWRWSTRLLFFLLACLTAPLWLSLHLLLLLWDRYQRRQWRIYQEAWPHLSLPHVRPVRYPADPSFSIDQWHLRCEDGRQRWFFGSTPATAEEGNAYTTAQMARAPRTTTSDAKEPTQAELRHTMEEKRQWLERYQLGLQPAEPTQRRERAADAMRDGAAFLLKLQDPFSGHWPNDYSGCQFLTPGVVFAKFIVAGGDLSAMFPPCETPHAPPETTCRCGEASRLELIRYLRNYQNEDGGWGQHTEGHSTMLGTVLSYITLRLLGTPAEDAQVARARVWIQEAGGATYTPMWGKVWLSVLGLYSWDGVDPIPPELALLPHWVPFSVGRSWCHSRVLSVPFSYLYGLRWSAPPHPLLTALKTELYAVPFDSINWRSCRGRICSTDLYTPPSSFFKLAGKLMSLYECYPIGPIRRYALELNWKYMAYDDENTNFICLGPVNKSLNMLITWLREGPKSTRYHMHQQRVADYFYMGPEGMRMSGYNGSQLWDTSFAVQALCACRLQHQHTDSVALAHHYVDVAQVQEDPIAADFFFRHRTKGAWNFSTRSQGWQVSDCTAEGLRVALLLPHLPFPTSRVYDGVDEILSLRNRSGDGGWASYEPSRAPAYCELFNCAELFKDVMIDYSYAECSSSCVHSLSLFRQQHPTYRRREVDTAISEGIACILSKQRRDGSFYGSWAVCFTYGAWIVADALRVSGELSDMANHPHCRRLVDFLLLHQNADGGWGEDVNACVRQVWVNNADGSQVVNTAWAVMAIMNACGSAECSSLPRRKKIVDAVEGGVGLIMARQLRSGDWRQERISGVFNGNNPIHYPGYKNCMPVWALGRYLSWKEEYAKDCSNGQQA